MTNRFSVNQNTSEMDSFGTESSLHFQTGLGIDATNLVSHFICTFECESMRITFASVDRPFVRMCHWLAVGFSIKVLQWVLDYPNPDYPYPDIWTSAHFAMFSLPAGKIRCCDWSFATGEGKAAVRMTFLNATTLFPSSTGFSSRFTTSELAERSRERRGERCSMQRSKLRGGLRRIILGFNHSRVIEHVIG